MSLQLGDDPVLIAGAGIAGLTCALMLARKGIPSIVLEKRTVLDEAGAGIQLSPNASRLLIDIGLGPALARNAVMPERIVIRRISGGRTLGIVPLGDHATTRFESPYWVLHRADLHTVLLDAVRAMPNVRLAVGRSVLGVTQVDGGVAMATGSDHAPGEILTGPVAIGADGLRSACRAAVGDDRKPRFRRFEAWRAVVPLSDAPAFAREQETGLWLGPDMHVVHYPVSGGRVVNIVAVFRAGRPLEGWGHVGDPAIVQSRLHEVRATRHLQDLIEAAPGWRVWSLHDLPVRRMAAKHIALAGDAAHPVLPFIAQGGALAIEDAATLAEVLWTTPEDIPRALTAYDRLRRPRARAVQEAASRSGRIYHLGGPLAAARDMAMATLGAERLAGRYDFIYDWRLTIE